MNIHIPLVRLLTIVALGGGLLAAVFQHHLIAQARLEHQALLKDKSETERLTRQNAQLAQLRATNAQVQQLRQHQRELLRLRDEVGRLRPQAAEAAKLQADNQRLVSLQKTAASPGQPTPMPADFIPWAAMADVGLGSPEATVQTYFYAICQGDMKRAAQCNPSLAPPQMTPQRQKELSNQLRQQQAQFPGFRIADKNVISADEVQIGVQSSPGGTLLPLHLIRTGTQWQINDRGSNE